MYPSSISRSITILACIFSCTATWAQNYVPSPELLPSTGTALSPSVRNLAITLQSRMIGVYQSDGKFHSADSIQGTIDQSEHFPGAPDQRVVPRSIHLRSHETIVQNFVPPARASVPVRGHSLLGSLRDTIVTFAYGNERVLYQPTHITTDSQRRLIVSDPEAATVHVIDPAGRSSFRISAGPGQRLNLPGSVAVDGEDNIYVADLKRGLIDVFDPEGHFLRYLGRVQGESIFDTPASIAINQHRGILYVLDGTADELIVLSLQGEILRRVGGNRSRGGLQLKHPTAIAVSNEEVLILDNFGSRITVLDLEGNPLHTFNIRRDDSPPLKGESRVIFDRLSNIYISNSLSSTVRVYGRDGRFLETLRLPGPTAGLWIDSFNQLYLTDTSNSRILVLQVQALFQEVAGVGAENESPNPRTTSNHHP